MSLDLPDTSNASESLQTKMLDCVSNSDKASADWQEKIARLVGLAHVETQRPEQPNAAVLRLMALIKLADYRGSKEAKRRKLNVARFRNGLGDGFQFPTDVGLREACLDVLSELKADWCSDFISGEFNSSGNAMKEFKLLIQWADRNATNPSAFFFCTLRPLMLSDLDPSSREFGIKSLQNFIKEKRFSECGQASDFLSSLLQCVVSVFSAQSQTEHSGKLLISLAQTAVQQVARVSPTLLVDSRLLLPLIDLERVCPPSAKKLLDKLTTDSTNVAVALVEGMLSLASDGTREYLAEVLPLLERAFPKLRKTLANIAKRNPSIGAVLDGEVNHQVEEAPSPEQSLCALLVRWRDFSPKVQAGDEDYTALDADIRRAAEAIGVSYLATPGERLKFDPVEHRLLRESSLFPPTVRVVRAGVKLTRSDGSTRVLYPALVEPSLA